MDKRTTLKPQFGGNLLPFLKIQNQGAASGIMTKMRKPDNKTDEQLAEEAANSEDNGNEMAQEAIHACAQDLIRAVHAQDVKGVAEAMQSAFIILESMPHEEGEHASEGSFKAQNVKAAQEQE